MNTDTNILKKIFTESLNDKKALAILFGYVFFLLYVCSNMSPFYYSNEWADVNIYFNVGKAIFNGKTLYTEVFDHKGPLIFFIYGFGYLISNHSFFGMFLIELLMWSTMICAVYYMARLYLNPMFACFTALLFPISLIELMKAGGSAEEFILVAECISMYFFVKYYKEKEASTHNIYYMLAHGAMCSIAFFIKINLIMFWFFPLLGIFLNLLLKKEFKNLFLNIFAFGVGFLIIAVPILSYLITHNALQEAYNIYIDLNSRYAEIQSVSDTIILLLYRLLFLFMQPLSLLILPLIGVFYFSVKCIGNVIGKWVMVLSGISLYSIIFMSPVFQFYYPIPFLVFTALGILGLFIIMDRLLNITVSFPVKYVLLFTVVIYYGAISRSNLEETKLSLYVDEKPPLLTQSIYDEISKEENPTLLNLGFGLGNSLFTTCNIVPNVRYFISPNLTYESYPDLRDEQEKYIENKATQFVLTQSWLSVTSYNAKNKKENMSDKEVSKVRLTNNREYFENLPAFEENYSLILTDTIMNTIDENSWDIYKLYRRND